MQNLSEPGAVSIFDYQQPGANITGAGFRSIYTKTIPGGLLGTQNILFIKGFIRRSVGVGNITLRLSYGGSDITTMRAASDVEGREMWRAWLWNENASNAQRAWVTTSMQGGGAGYSTGAIDSTQDQTLVISGDLATDTDVFVCDMILARLFKRLPSL